METNSYQWHVDRQKNILKEFPDVKKLLKPDSLWLINIVLLVLCYSFMIYFSQYLSLFMLILLSATVGAYITFGFFNYCHDVCHSHFYHYSFRILLMKLCTFLLIGNTLYFYFRWGHLSHHKNQGKYSVEDDYLFTDNYVKDHDPDVLGLSAYLAIKQNSYSEPEHIFKNFYVNRLLRPFIVALLPVLELFLGNFYYNLLHPLYMKIKEFHHKYKNISSKYTDPFVIERVNSRLLSALQWISLSSLIFYLIGIKAIVFMLLSQLFMRGFLLHPYLVYWTAIHSSHYLNHQTCQPTTSVYGKFTDFIMHNSNYHVEHHDFPSISSRKISKLYKIAKPNYEAIYSFNNIFQAYKEFFSHKGNRIYSCQTFKESLGDQYAI